MKSQFIAFFGDPKTNSKGWPVSTISGVSKNILSGQCLNGEPRILRTGEKAVLKVSAVTYGYFKADEYKVILDNSQITKGVFPQKGDLLFSRANTREYVGATCLVDKDYPDLLLPDKLWKIILTDKVLPVYMKAYLSMPSIREELSARATGTSGSMFNISMPKLRELRVMLPPLDLQQQFSDFISASDKSKFVARQATSYTYSVIKWK